MVAIRFSHVYFGTYPFRGLYDNEVPSIRLYEPLRLDVTMPRTARACATLTVLIVALTALGACTATSAGPRSNSGVITSAELDEVGALNVYEAVQRLRPRWLQVRSGRSLTMGTRVLAYYDNSRLGEVDALRQISIEGIHSIEYLDGGQASAQLSGIGSEHVAGAIVVRTRPDR